MENTPAGSVIIDDPQESEVMVETPESSFDEQQIADNVAEVSTEAGEDGAQAEKEVVDLERYKNLERKMSEQGAELGQLRQMTAQLQEQNQQLQQMAQKAQEPMADFDAQITDIANKVESGDISVAEGMRMQAQIASEQAQQQAAQQAEQLVSTKFQELEQQKIADQFKAENPDFDELVQSGALEAIKASNPVHDNVSAYFAFKAQTLAEQAEQKAKAAFLQGKQEQEKLESGKQVASKTLTQPGANAQQTPNQKPLTEGEIQAKMLARLQAMRSSAA